MQHILIVVDMQTDFVDGALGSAHAAAILPAVREKILNFKGKIIYTRDTHEADYMQTREGRHLPVAHCIRNTEGWQIHPALRDLPADCIIDKPTFGSVALMQELSDEHRRDPIADITLIGLCTDICVISNALCLKARLWETPIAVCRDCCAGVTPASHENALAAMAMCQIDIL